MSWCIPQPTGKLGWNCLLKSGTSMLDIGLMATAITCNPRGPYSLCNPLNIWTAGWQCGQVVKMNARTTTLPLNCAGEISPDGVKWIVSSGEGRGWGAFDAACAINPKQTSEVKTLRITILLLDTSKFKFIASSRTWPAR